MPSQQSRKSDGFLSPLISMGGDLFFLLPERHLGRVYLSIDTLTLLEKSHATGILRSRIPRGCDAFIENIVIYSMVVHLNSLFFTSSKSRFVL